MRLLATITKYMRLPSVALVVHVAKSKTTLIEMPHDVASHLGCLLIPIDQYTCN